jgi:4-hydroxy-2-oxoglutarate aldolase
MKLQGMFASAATPFDYTGAVYRAKVQHNFDKWRRTSLAGFLIGGLTGEGPLLEAHEKIEVLRLAMPMIPAGRTVILDVTCEGVQGALNLTKQAAEAGAQAVISLPPHQYRDMMSRPETQCMFYRALADESPVPVLIHNAPHLTGVDLLPETLAKLAVHRNIHGVLDCGTPGGRIEQIRALADKEFAVLEGTEGKVWESLKAGANGAVLAFGSAAPYATIAIWEAFRTREEEAGLDWQARIAHPSILVTDLYGVPGLKHAMDLNGYYGGPPRLPFSPIGTAARAEIEAAFRDLKG